MMVVGDSANNTPHDSILDGGDPPTFDITTLPEALFRAARHHDAGYILHIRHDETLQRQTYPGLLHESSCVLGGLQLAGAQPQDKVVLYTDDPVDLLVGFWACLLGGLVPVPLRRANARPHSLDPLWTDEDRVWLLVGEDARQEVETPPGKYQQTQFIRQLADSDATQQYHQADGEDLALLLLTSGSTGTPKAVALTHHNILGRCIASCRVNEFDSTVSSFNWMPLDHVGGLVMFHFRDVYLASTQVHAPMEWVLEDPLRWVDSMSRFGSTVTWAPNFAFGLINDNAERAANQDWDLSRLDHIMNGGESIKRDTLRRFLDLLRPFGLSSDAVYPGWGMSETSGGVAEGRFIPSDLADARFAPIGVPHPGVALRIVDENDDPVLRGSVGLLQVSGTPIATHYYNNPEHNQEAFTTDGWFRTGDQAFDDNGSLNVTGRVNDVITIGGLQYHGHEIEEAVEQLGVATPSYTVATEVTSTGESESLAVFFHPRSGNDVDEAAADIRAVIAKRFGLQVGHVVPIAKKDVPKTGIGKLRRIQLRRRFEQSFPHRAPQGARSMSNTESKATWM